MNPYLGTILMVAFNFAPPGWFLCEGQLLPIAEYTALFSLLGTTYGGDGRTTFGLPHLSGRIPLCMGQAPGSTVPHSLGQTGSFGGDTQPPTEQYMTVNFIIAYQGIFPARS